MAEPLHWPDGQPVTPWADPWHDVAADLARIRERENLPYPGRFTPPPPDCPYTGFPQFDNPAWHRCGCGYRHIRIEVWGAGGHIAGIRPEDTGSP